MTKTLTKTTLAILALGLASPAMAADGALGGTSSAQINVSLEVTPNTDDHVQIIGLDDIVFPSVSAGADVNLINSQDIYFCANKNTPGPIKIHVGGAGYVLSNDPTNLLREIQNGSNFAFVKMLLREASTGYSPPSDNGWTVQATNPATCSSSSGDGVAHKIEAKIGLRNEAPLVQGTYASIISFLISAQ